MEEFETCAVEASLSKYESLWYNKRYPELSRTWRLTLGKEFVGYGDSSLTNFLTRAVFANEEICWWCRRAIFKYILGKTIVASYELELEDIKKSDKVIKDKLMDIYTTELEICIKEYKKKIS
jgi:hypothetical protein